MAPRRIAFWMLAVAGVAVGHIVGYGVAHPDAAGREAALGGHAYLPVVASIVVPIGVLTALVWAVRTAAALHLAGRIDVRHLAVAQVAIFGCQEIAERVISGAGPTSALTERGVWVGIVAQVLVAVIVVRSIDLVRRAVRFVSRGQPRTVGAARAERPWFPRPVWRSTVAPVAVGLRAPPMVGSPC